MGKQSKIRRAKSLHRTGDGYMHGGQPLAAASISARNARRIVGAPPVNASVGRGRKSRIRPILNADGERIGQTHIRGAFPGFAPGRCPRAFRGCQSPRARSRRAAKAAKLVNAG